MEGEGREGETETETERLGLCFQAGFKKELTLFPHMASFFSFTVP